MRFRPRLPVFALLCCISGCVANTGSQVEVVEVVADDRPLAGGLDSLDAVGRAVVDGLNAGEARGLMQLVLTEADFARLFDVLSNHPNARQMGQ